MGPSAAPRPLLFGMLLQSAALMTTEVVMTRVFSVVVWYHFAFFAISVALFGAGVAGVVTHALGGALSSERAKVHVTWAAAAFSASTLVTDVVLTRLVPGWFDSFFSEPPLVALWHVLLLFLASAAPFFAGGYAVSLVLSRNLATLGTLYAVDLVGGAAGAVLSVPLLSLLGGPGALVAASVIGAGAALAFARSAERPHRKPAALALLAAAAGVALLATPALDSVRAKGFDLRRTPPEFDRWNAFSRVTVFGDAPFHGWGTSPTYRLPIPEQKALFIDMAAFTTLTRFDGEPRSAAHTLFDLSAFAYRVHPRLRDACVIGAGGGKDVLAALAAGARHVTAAEINPLVVEDVVGGKFREFSGDLYSRPDVHVHVEDGRSLLRGSSKRFDVVLISMVDTSAASTAGAFALTENSLYTVEAFTDFLDHLEPEGILSVSTVTLQNLALGARLVSVARAALERRGADPSRTLAMLHTPWLGGVGGIMNNLLVAPDGFSDDLTSKVSTTAKELGFFVGYVPGQRAPVRDGEGEWLFRIATEPEPAELARYLERFPFDLRPTTDDRPFFFYQDRMQRFFSALARPGTGHLAGQGLTVLSKIFVITLLLVLGCLVVPAAVAKRRAAAGGGAAAWDVAYVSCLGLGFLLIEVAFIQKLSLYLGQPTYTLAVVLSVLLLTSGLGAHLLPRRLASFSPRGLAWFLAVTVLFVALVGAFLGPALGRLLGAPPFVRAVAAAALIAPVGLLLGAPFPTGLGVVALRAPDRIAWLWAVNSATSVLGSVVATIVSLHAGVSATFVAGLGAYVLAAVLAVPVARLHTEAN